MSHRSPGLSRSAEPPIERRAMVTTTALSGLRVRAELSPCAVAPLVCVIANPDETQISVSQNQNRLIIDPGDWYDALSPWPAPAVDSTGSGFGGHAERFLQTLITDVLPAAEDKFGLSPACRALCGYSLAGLFALYALYRTNVFACIASASGSLWYDGFLDFLRTSTPCVPNARVRLSLGDREEFARNPRLAAVGDATRRAEEILRSQGLDVTLTMNPGGHFREMNLRLSRLIEDLSL